MFHRKEWADIIVHKLKIMNDITLKLPTENDINFLYDCENDEIGMFKLGNVAQDLPENYRDNFLSPNSWTRSKMIKYHNMNIGWIRAGISPKDRNATVSMYIIPKARNKGVTHVAIYKFLKFLFEVESHHKVDFLVYDFNKDSMNNFKLFHKDGTKRDEKWFKGRYWDQHIYSLLESEWYVIKPILENKLHRLNEIYLKRYEDRYYIK